MIQEASGEKEDVGEEQSLDLSVKSSSYGCGSPPSFSQTFHLLPAQLLASSPASLNFMVSSFIMSEAGSAVDTKLFLPILVFGRGYESCFYIFQIATKFSTLL
jgi:hypothetical protein